MRLKFFDFFAVFISISIIVLMFIITIQKSSDKKQVHIVAGNSEYYYPLEKDSVVNISGPIGVTTVKIEKGSISVTDSPCPDKLCIHQGKINQSGQWIACLPNKVLITITGKTEELTDEISY